MSAQPSQTESAPRVAWRSFGERTSTASDHAPSLLQAALSCFVDNGYHGTSIRQIASAAGLSVPGLYHHFPSKQAMLVAIDREAMHDLFTRSTAALADVPQTSLARFDRLVECLVLFHAYRAAEAFVTFSEIRSLEGEARSEHISARDAQQQLLDRAITDGVADGTFVLEHPRDASRAITTICTGVSQWYRPDGRLTPEDVARRYGEICRRAAGYGVR